MGHSRNKFIINPKCLNLALIFETLFQVLFYFVSLQSSTQAIDQVLLSMQSTNVSLSLV